jgi:hypothetical protein
MPLSGPRQSDQAGLPIPFRLNQRKCAAAPSVTARNADDLSSAIAGSFLPHRLALNASLKTFRRDVHVQEFHHQDPADRRDRVFVG